MDEVKTNLKAPDYSFQNSDQFNIDYAESGLGVDKINKVFYEKFNYPWSPSSFLSINDNSLIKILNQDIGDFTHKRIPENIRIWVAGCGTNQALITALKFPSAQVLGTDISTTSLGICRENAEQIGLKNLKLEEKSLNDIDYKEEFDYIICTGVIHHNADPENTLSKISEALKKDGILELMVYNYFHRILKTAFQKGMRALLKRDDVLDFDTEVEITQKLIDNFPSQYLMSSFLERYKGANIARIADELLQPVEYSYTVKTLDEMVNRCNLEILLPCINQFDKSTNTFNWNIRFNDTSISSIYDSLPDLDRWQIANLFMMNQSPQLWFYVQRQDSDYKRKTEHEICDDFLKTKFNKLNISSSLFGQTEDEKFKFNKNLPFPLPPKPIDKTSREIFEKVSPEYPMNEILTGMGLKPSFDEVNTIRVHLTTLISPYLVALSE